MYGLAIFLPLLAAVISGVMGYFARAAATKKQRHSIDHLAWLVTVISMLLSAAICTSMFVNITLQGDTVLISLLSWISSGDLHAEWSIRLDTLSVVMLVTVSIISSMIHIYSWGYMHNDVSIPRFQAYLSLFTFCMFMLVTANDLLQLFFGWEGVGLCSYLLIGFWYKRKPACAAAIKAFVVNRVGDLAFILGILGVFLLTDSIDFDRIFFEVTFSHEATLAIFGIEFHMLTVICLLLFIGAMGKSAQIGLHVWLPDAMEGPTPVSALIHAATMVTAGVFMVARFSPLFEFAPVALTVVTIVGALTAIFAATVGCVQNDIKRVIAYSTCSQLGYMFFALGVSAYSAAIFHLMTHAFFKSLLFLCAGSVIHAMSDEQDMRKMGGIWKLIPITYGLMWIGSLALVGIPPFSGYFSKDIILEAAWASASIDGRFAFTLGILAAFLTAFYSWRLLFMTFHGTPHAGEKVLAHVHESPKIMLVPLCILAFGAIFSGFAFYDYFVGSSYITFWGQNTLFLNEDNRDLLEIAHAVPLLVKLSPLIVGLLGISLAYFLYIWRPDVPGRIAKKFPLVYQFLLNKWYFDELYNRIFVKPIFRLGNVFWKQGDQTLIDGAGPDGLSFLALRLSKCLSKIQSGYIYHYVLIMFIGIVFLITWAIML